MAWVHISSHYSKTFSSSQISKLAGPTRLRNTWRKDDERGRGTQLPIKDQSSEWGRRGVCPELELPGAAGLTGDEPVFCVAYTMEVEADGVVENRHSVLCFSCSTRRGSFSR